ncbi:MAG: prolyl oligopeptidase family serine peptidase [Polyangiaceae bacterium]|nr:prolyl oligopeptidase family serine peptidase [Polyangiaceae bacterium]
MLKRSARLLVSSAAVAVDRAVTLAAERASAGRRRKNPAESLGHGARLAALDEMKRLYPEQGDGGFFPSPRAIEPQERVVRWTTAGDRVFDLCWPSIEHTFLPELEPRYGRFLQNHVATARLLTRGEPRPVAILIHGYLGGAFNMEQRVWPIEWLMRMGLDVALFVLPFHGPRADPKRAAPPFPSSDPRMTNEGFRQAMTDLRELVRYLSERGHPAVGVMGMSLGGYSTALAATLEDQLAFAIPIIPLASVADFARYHGRLGKDHEQTALQHAALESVHRIVSPVHRPPRLPPERLMVIGARADRITPVEHARRLAHHFGVPLHSWAGGHLLQVGRADAFRKVGRFLGELGLTERRPPRR